MQTMVECIKTRAEISLVVRSLEPGFLDLMKDSNGNHVGQRCFEKLSSEDNKVSSQLTTFRLPKNFLLLLVNMFRRKLSSLKLVDMCLA